MIPSFHYIPYNKAMFCPDCDVIYPINSSCPICCNKNGVGMNAIRNNVAKELGDLKDRRGEVRSSNYNQLSLQF